MRDRYFGSRVKRLFREKGWSMASFSRRTAIGRSVLKRIMETRGYDYHVTRAQTTQLAAAFDVTVDYLERGVVPAVQPPSATASQFEIARLRAEVDRLRRRRTSAEQLDAMRAGSTQAQKARDALSWATANKLEIVFRNDKFVILREHEYEIAEASTIEAALAIAKDGENDD